MTVPQKTPIAVFRLGDVCLKIVAVQSEGAPARFWTTIEKLIDPRILKENPTLAYTFTPQDISAIRKLTKEAEDALFNYQSAVLQPIAPPPANTTDDKDND
tara:strand:- start:119 stop:421 length:303 start_codon:yes stop_codon:yes gene_type:complete